MRWAITAAGAAALLLTGDPVSRLAAQARDTSLARAPVAARSNTTRRVNAVQPIGALWRSLLVPGWGQARTGRAGTGAAFVVWEGFTVMMIARAVQEKHYMEETGSENLPSKRQQIQDWVVLLGFNHLFAGAEAYVAAHLQDFPKELKIRAGPRRIGVSFPLP